MKLIKNQVGITLIEVLATLTILSFLMVIVYNVFFNGLNYSSQAKDTVSIQQEANYLLTLLKELHENEDFYTVTVEEDHQTVTINEISVNNPQFLYQVCNLNDPSPCNEQNTIVIENPAKESFYVRIVLTSKNNPDLTYEVKTILSRL
jgi:type II secretory pathway pseudopilin PulG